jgi:Predicted membrane protein
MRTASASVTLILTLLSVLGIVALSFVLADYIRTNDVAQGLVQTLGYAGVFIIAFLFNLNLVLPIPPASFLPVFTAAGLNFWLSILTITAGTLVADFVGYAVGSLSRKAVANRFPQTVTRVEAIYRHRRNL